MILVNLVALSLSGAMALAPSVAQPVSQLGDLEQRCELHIWPAERLDGISFQLYNGLIRGRASDNQIEGAMEDLLSPSSQLAALHDGSLLNELRLPSNTKIIEHLEPLNAKTLNKIKVRSATSSSPCYSELIIVKHLLIEDIVWGDRFMSWFQFRDFSDKSAMVYSLKGWGGNKLKVLTLSVTSRPNDAPQLAGAAIRANFQEFAKKARTKSPRSKI